MNTLQIENILFNDYKSKKYFKAVIEIDELPRSKRKIKNSAYVINTDKKSGQGEHWISFFYDKNSNCEFFDSLGFGPEFYSLDGFLLKTGKKVFTNNFAIQSIFSEYCGYYAILFVLLRSRNISFETFLEYFNIDSIKNDLKIKNFINKFI
jgi:hypothetical protein